MTTLAQFTVDSVAKDLADRLTLAWDNGSGQEFAKSFTQDAVFVNVYGEMIHSRPGIAKGHQIIFAHAFKDVQNHYELIAAAQIDDNTILSHNKAHITGKESGLTMTLVIVKRSEGWLIRALHNTETSNNPFANH